MVLQPFIEIPKVINSTYYSICEVGEKLATDSENSIVSHHIENQIQTGGSFILSPSHDYLLEETPIENVLAMYDAVTTIRNVQ